MNGTQHSQVTAQKRRHTHTHTQDCEVSYSQWRWCENNEWQLLKIRRCDLWSTSYRAYYSGWIDILQDSIVFRFVLFMHSLLRELDGMEWVCWNSPFVVFQPSTHTHTHTHAYHMYVNKTTALEHRSYMKSGGPTHSSFILFSLFRSFISSLFLFFFIDVNENDRNKWIQCRRNSFC